MDRESRHINILVISTCQNLIYNVYDVLTRHLTSGSFNSGKPKLVQGYSLVRNNLYSVK